MAGSVGGVETQGKRASQRLSPAEDGELEELQVAVDVLEADGAEPNADDFLVLSGLIGEN